MSFWFSDLCKHVFNQILYMVRKGKLNFAAAAKSFRKGKFDDGRSEETEQSDILQQARKNESSVAKLISLKQGYGVGSSTGTVGEREHSAQIQTGNLRQELVGFLSLLSILLVNQEFNHCLKICGNLREMFGIVSNYSETVNEVIV